MFDDHGPRNSPARVQHKVFEQAEFFRGQLNAFPRPLDLPFHAIKFEIGNRQHRCRRHMAPSQQGANSGRQFGKRERLTHVIVGAKIQALHAIFNPVSAGQHQYRHTGLAWPKVPQNRHPVEARKIQVHHKKVIVELGCHGFGLFAVMRDVNGIVFSFKTLPNKTRQGGIIFSNQKSHSGN